jgi:hypothetical protein
MRVLRTIMLPSTLLAWGALTATGCGGTDQQPEMPDPTVVQRSADDLGLPAPEEEAAAEEETAEADLPPPPVRIVAGEREAVEGDAPTVRIVRPRDGQTIRRGNVSLRLEVESWDLAAAPGRHVHVIVDNEPYIAIRDVSEPLDLNALVQEHHGHELAEGTHVVRVFASRDHHESVKSDGAFDMAVFHYRSESDDFDFDPEAPLLTYSRPKGCNVAGERILVDFYLTNVEELAEDGYHVRYDIDGALTGDLTSWVPHWIENLPAMPQHTVRLQLVDAEGELVPGPFNDTTRTISVQESCE